MREFCAPGGGKDEWSIKEAVGGWETEEETKAEQLHIYMYTHKRTLRPTRTVLAHAM